MSSQPIHVVYGGAHLFKAETIKKLESIALKSFEENIPHVKTLDKIFNVQHPEKIYSLVHQKLKQNSIEDYRIDFEDGYGVRSDQEEDLDSIKVANILANNAFHHRIGIRIKSLSPQQKKRSLRTLDIFFKNYFKQKKSLPENFVITLPKVENKKQTIAFQKMIQQYETKYKLKKNSIKIELMVETPALLPHLKEVVQSLKGRCQGVHFGTYDYTSLLNIVAHEQTMTNPVCDYAKHVIQTTLFDTSIELSDGATTLMPVGGQDQIIEAYTLIFKNIKHSLKTGWYQGWDLHPSQIPVRYIALFDFLLNSKEQMLKRLESFLNQEAQANLLGNVFDDEASAKGILNYLMIGLKCGAILESDLSPLGITASALETKSFQKLCKTRKD